MNDRKETAYIWEITAIFCGVVGTIGCFLTTFPLEYHPFLYWGILLLLGILFYYVYTKRKRKNEMAGIAVGYGAFVLLSYPLWQKALPYFMATILKVYEGNSQYRFKKPTFTYFIGAMETPGTFLLLVITIPLLLLIIRSIRCKHSYFLAFFATVPFIGAILLFTLPLSPLYGTMLLFYVMILYGMANAGKQGSAQIKLNAGGALGLCALLLIGALRLYQPSDSYIRDQRMDHLRDELLEGFSLSVQNRYRTDENGTIDLSRQGDRVYTGRVDLQVMTDHPQSLYLHAYSAALYEDNRWTQMSDDRYQNSVATLSSMDVSPFFFADDSAKGFLSADDLTEVQISNRNADDHYLYTPYFMRDDFGDLPLVRDAYIDGSDMDEEYTYHIWNESALDSLVDNPVIESYRKKLTSAYASISVFMRDELKRIDIPGLSNHGTREEKIKAIQNYLRSFGTYTLHPGQLPPDQDFVLYFLQTSKQGYCVHYASAAVLLLRSYGIEARYASGYYVNASDFQDGVALVKDAQAHAWVEILDPIKGWTVLEVTPAATETASAQTQPDESTPAQDQPQESVEEAQTSQNQVPPRQDFTEQMTSDDQTQPERASYASWYLFLLIPLLITPLPLRRYIRCKMRDHHMHDSDCRAAILACGEYLYQLGIKDEDMDQAIKECLQEAKFSHHTLSLTQRKAVLAYCEKCRKARRMKASLPQRFVDRYIRCL